MNIRTLQDILSAPFNSFNWQLVLTEVFGVKHLLSFPRQLELPTNELVSAAFELGKLETTDERYVGIYEVRLLSSVKIERNRIGLRELLRSIITNDVDAALIVFASDAQPEKWRFSFVSEFRMLNPNTDQIERQTTDRKRYTYLLGQGESSRTAAQRFHLLQGRPYTLSDLFEAFNVEKLNDEFFNGYFQRHKAFWSYIRDVPEYRDALLDHDQTDIIKAEKPIRDFAKKLLGRIVFLYFLQKKEWLGVSSDRADWRHGDSKFIKNLFLGFPLKSAFYSDCLTVLFFNTLNTDRESTNFIFPLTGTKVPYLNGGLFENDLPHTDHFNFPERYFEDLFEFFDQYNFTIDENDPDDSEVGIDPEMLGHIFENLLEENSEKGTFYTPKAIVQYMCQESLIQYLNIQLTDGLDVVNQKAAQLAISDFIRCGARGEEHSKTNFILKNARRLEQLLDHVKICDPAIGSGAFPMGMLIEIFKAKTTLDWTLDPATVKRHIIQNSIYGVDIDKGAVDVARLRFWLALIVDEDFPSPLPNLDYKIMQGNSLLESFDGIDLSRIHEQQMAAFQPQLDLFGNLVNPQLTIFQRQDSEDLQVLINQYFDAENLDVKRYLRQQINGKVHAHIEFNIELRERQLLRRVQEAGKIQNLKPKARKEFDKLLAIHEGLIKSREKLVSVERRAEKPFFLWHLYFKDVFEQGGFDIVIGNPPYIQLAKLKDNALQGAGYETYSKGGDIYCLFYELGIRFLKEDGVLSYITSNSWLQTLYGQFLRDYLLREADPLILVNFSDTLLFNTAVVETNILIARKAEYAHHMKVAMLDKTYSKNSPISDFVAKNSYIQTDLDSGGWSIGNQYANALRKRIEDSGLQLSQWNLAIFRGVTTGYNPAFIIDDVDTYLHLLAEDPNNVELIKPTLRGRDIKKYSYKFDNQWVICTFPVKNIDIESYPSIKKHLLSYGQERLEQSGGERSRKKTNNKWFETQDQISYWRLFEEPKIVWGELSDDAKFTFDDQGYYVEATTFMMTGESLKYLLGVLNSKVAQWYFEQIATTSGMGTNRWKKYKILQLPVPRPNIEVKEQIEHLVNNVLNSRDAIEGSPRFFVEAQIDALICQIYGLTQDDVRYILDTFPSLSEGSKTEIINQFRNIEKGNFKLLV